MNAQDRPGHEGDQNARPVPPRQLWLLAAGFGLWGSATIALYALHAVGCAFAWPTGTLRLVLGLVLFAHLAVIGWLGFSYAKTRPQPAFGAVGQFLHWVVMGTLIAAFVAVVCTLGPTLLLVTCV